MGEKHPIVYIWSLKNYWGSVISNTFRGIIRRVFLQFIIENNLFHIKGSYKGKLISLPFEIEYKFIEFPSV